jgi:predicted kinase
MNPRLIIVNGLPASGKSTLAKHLSNSLQIPYFGKDDFKELIVDSTGLVDLETTRKFGKVSYEIQFLIARRCLSAGASLIIEGNFTLGNETKVFVEEMRESAFDTYEIQCFAKGDILVERFLTRDRHQAHTNLSDADYRAYAEGLRVEKLPQLGFQQYLEVDTSVPESIDYSAIEGFLGLGK